MKDTERKLNQSSHIRQRINLSAQNWNKIATYHNLLKRDYFMHCLDGGRVK